MIDVSDWDELVEKTYGRKYSFQQQDGCQERRIFELTVPGEADDYENDIVPEVVNHDEMGVSFKAWLERDPTQPLNDPDDTEEENKEQWRIAMWWERNFYPNVQMIANDLYTKGLLKKGTYCINID